VAASSGLDRLNWIDFFLDENHARKENAMSDNQFRDERPTLNPFVEGPAATPPAMPAAGPYYAAYAPQPAKRSGVRRFFKVCLWVVLGLVLFGSLMLNLALLGMMGGGLEGDRGLATKVLREGNHGETVAQYDVSGIIDDRAAGEFDHFFRGVADDKNVKAVLLRVNSPGGSVSASDQIHHRVSELRSKGKKVVVSMGGLAASGGYYISAPADEIYAEQTTVTGSVGVIASWVILRGTLDKIGMEPMVMKSTSAQAWKDEMSPFRKPADYQKQHLQEVLDTMQKRFEGIVRGGRGGKLVTKEVKITMPPAEPNAQPTTVTTTAPLNGKIYLGEEAKEMGLVDQIGYWEDAVRGAEKIAGLRKARVVRYSRRMTLFDIFAAKSEPGLKLEASLLDRLQTPQFMMIWKAE
jgi:protease-4